MLDRGYYEDLTNVVRFNTTLGDLYNEKPPNWERCWAMHGINGYPDWELLPNKHVWFKGAMMSTNRWGMRDRDCEKSTPPGTYRIAVLGASHPMGTGVEDDQVFDNIAEDRLTRARPDSAYARYELLNFSVGGFGPIQMLADYDRRVKDFGPGEFGGLGMDALTTVGVLESLGYGCEDNGLVFSINAHMWTLEMPILGFGTEAQKQKFLPKLTSGEWIGANAMSEPGSGSDAYSMATTAKKKGDVYLLNGSKVFVLERSHRRRVPRLRQCRPGAGRQRRHRFSGRTHRTRPVAGKAHREDGPAHVSHVRSLLRDWSRARRYCRRQV